MIAVIDSGVANLHSVVHALKFLEADATVHTTPDGLQHADRIILPGVGAFSAGMATLRTGGFIEPLRELAASGIPILGVCLGMQLLFDRSEEMGEHEGLALLEGAIVRFPAGSLKVPHIGWNQLEHDGSSPLLAGIESGSYAYFVHSYFAQTVGATQILAHTDYGELFPSVVGRGNIFGAQFHPEKSQATGLRLLKNFIELQPS